MAPGLGGGGGGGGGGGQELFVCYVFVCYGSHCEFIGSGGWWALRGFKGQSINPAQVFFVFTASPCAARVGGGGGEEMGKGNSLIGNCQQSAPSMCCQLHGSNRCHALVRSCRCSCRYDRGNSMLGSPLVGMW